MTSVPTCSWSVLALGNEDSHRLTQAPGTLNIAGDVSSTAISVKVQTRNQVACDQMRVNISDGIKFGSRAYVTSPSE